MSSRQQRPSAGSKRSLSVNPDCKVTIEVIETRGETVRLEVADDRRWRIDVTPYEEVELVMSWNEEGDLDDPPLPDWLGSVLAQLGFEGVDA